MYGRIKYHHRYFLEVDSKKELGVSSFVYKNLEARAQGGGTRHIFFSILFVCETVVDYYLERETCNTPCVNKMVGAENLSAVFNLIYRSQELGDPQESLCS